MLASYRVHELSSAEKTPGLSVLRTKVFRSLIACKTFYHQTCAKTSPILLFWSCSMTTAHSKKRSQSLATFHPPSRKTHRSSPFGGGVFRGGCEGNFCRSLTFFMSRRAPQLWHSTFQMP